MLFSKEKYIFQDVCPLLESNPGEAKHIVMTDHAHYLGPLKPNMTALPPLPLLDVPF